MRIAAHVKLTEVDKQLVLLDARKNEYFVINETGKVILLAIQEGKNVSECIRRVESSFDQSGSVEQDVTEFVELLLQKKLLEKF